MSGAAARAGAEARAAGAEPVIAYLSSPLERGFVRDTVERLPPIYYVAAEKALKDTRIVERHVKKEPVKPRGLRTMIYYGS